MELRHGPVWPDHGALGVGMVVLGLLVRAAVRGRTQEAGAETLVLWWAVALAPWLLAGPFQEVASIFGVALPGPGAEQSHTPPGAVARAVRIVYGGCFVGLRLGGPIAALVFTLRWIASRLHAGWIRAKR